MAGGNFGVVFRHLERLFAAGSVAGLTEGQLLDRLARQGDEAAFEAIVARHGPMVLGICRRVLRDPGDVEDAFQATFLVLVQKAGSLRRRDLLGNWLFGVASRVALRARAVAARRRAMERSGPAIEPAAPASGDDPGAVADRELQVILHEELGRLPAKYRRPVLLCYLEGLSHEEAARQLGWPLGTVKGRLARARELLRTRLTRRGVAVPASAVAAAIARQADATVPAALVQSTVQGALAVAAGRTLVVGAVAANVATLVKGVTHAMSYNALKPVVIIAIAGVLATGAGVWAYQPPGPAQPGQPPRSPLRGAFPRVAPARPSSPQPGPAPEVPVSKAVPPTPAAGFMTKEMTRQRIASLAAEVAASDRNPGTRAILAKLEEPVAMAFPDETPLEDVLKYIQAATEGPDKKRLPIYVEPAGLSQAEKTLTSPITLDLEGVPLKTTLRLVLKQLDLAYCVRDGVLIISSVNGIQQELLEAQSSAPDEFEADSPAAGPPKSKEGEAPPEGEPSAAKIAEATGKLDARRAKLEKLLDAPIKFSIAADTPLGDLLRSINLAADPSGRDPLQVYVDPRVRDSDWKTTTDFEVEGIPLRVALSLLLDQVKQGRVVQGLQWDVLDGLLVVSTQQGLQEYKHVVSMFQASSPRIQKLLDTSVTLSFPGPTPLGEIVKSIRDAIRAAGGVELSLYYGPSSVFRDGDPAKQVEIASWPVQLEVKDVPVRTCLGLVLGQARPFPATALGGRIIDNVLIIGTHLWISGIHVPQRSTGP
jgi:RNA polymerase sigma factor (sigma-70 family)